jgi:hypothetical protein
LKSTGSFEYFPRLPFSLIIRSGIRDEKVSCAGNRNTSGQNNSPPPLRLNFFIKFAKTRDAPDTVFAGYPANQKAGYRISGKGRISLATTGYNFGKISNKFMKTALTICKHYITVR